MVFNKKVFPWINVLPACISVRYVYTWHLGTPEEGVKSSGTVVIFSCELPHGYWDSNLGPLKDQKMLLNTEPSFTFLSFVLNSWFF